MPLGLGEQRLQVRGVSRRFYVKTERCLPESVLANLPVSGEDAGMAGAVSVRSISRLGALRRLRLFGSMYGSTIFHLGGRRLSPGAFAKFPRQGASERPAPGPCGPTGYF